MKKHLFLTVATMLTLVATAGLLRAIAGPAPSQQRAPGGDAQFMTRAAEGGLAEVELSRLAQQKSASKAVKAAARKIQTDHETANAELRTLAEKLNVELPEAPDAAHQEARDQFEKLSGAAFDKAWAEQMVKDHETAIQFFETHAKSGADAEVRAFAAKQLPALRAHLKQAQDLLEAGAGGRRARR